MGIDLDPIPSDPPNAPEYKIVEIAPLQAPGIVEKSPDNDAIYRAIRGEITGELTLITARVNWLIASQAFLFMPLTIGSRSGALSDSSLYPLVPLLGLALCALILLSICAAVWRSQQWRRKARHGAYRGDSGKGEFSIVLPHTPVIPIMGLVGSIGVPTVLIVTWIYILLLPVIGG